MGFVDLYSSTYRKFILFCDVFTEESESCSTQFLNDHNAQSLLTEKKTILKIKVITSSSSSFENIMKTFLSNCHEIVATVLKISF